MSDVSRRRAVLAEATEWLKTPYHHAGRVKGAGVDCLTLLAEVYERTGIIPHVEIPFYPPDWHLHRDAERYLEGVMRYAREYTCSPFGRDGDEVVKPVPELGDIAIFKFGRCFAHGVIVTGWPQFIAANVDLGQVIAGSATDPWLAKRAARFFDPF